MSSMYTAMIATGSFLALLVSCNQDSRVPALQSQVTALEAKVSQLEDQISVKEMFKDLETIAYLTPGSAGYSVLRSNLGQLTVSLTNVQPYANGSKVTLQFGNLTAAGINGLKAKVEWGSLDKQGTPNNQDAKSREMTFTESFQSGSWTNVNVVLEGIPPAALGFVRVRDVGHTGISLRR